MNPEVFGPIIWKYLHLATVMYPQKPTLADKNEFKNLLYGFGAFLPCSVCTYHYRAYIQDNINLIDMSLNSQNGIFEFVWEFHNNINKRLGKNTMSLRSARSMYRI
jgi:hypothetical protein